MRTVVAISVIVGGTIRVVETAQRHALGFDDSLLAINIVTRSFRDLTRPLSFEQVAPILFLWSDRLAVDLGGINDLALRLIPLIAGVAVPILTWIVGRRLVPPPAAALAVALVALSPLAVDYSSSAKPYIVDAAVALALVAVWLRTIRHADRVSAWCGLAGAGAIGILMSTPAVFTLTACAAATPLALSPAHRRAHAGKGLVPLLVCGTVAAINYVVLQEPVRHEPYLRHFWENAYFVPGAPNLIERIRVVASSYSQNIFFGTNLRAPILARVAIAFLAVAGIVGVTRRSGLWVPTLMAGPLAVAVIASAARMYPPSDRTWLFTAPFTVLLTTAGVWTLAGALSRSVRCAAFVLAGLALVYLPGRQSWLALRASLEPDNLRRALTTWRAESAAGEPIYVFGSDAVRWTYYTTNWQRPDTVRVHALLALARTIGPNSGNAPPRGHAVRDEGDGLVYLGSGRAELIGTPTGIEGGILNHAQPTPDTGWADNEARRIASAALTNGGSIWILAIHAEPEKDSAVVAAAILRGASLVRAVRFASVHLYRLRVGDRTPGASTRDPRTR